MPTGESPACVGVNLLKISIGDLWLGAVRLDSPEVLGLAGHGNEQRGLKPLFRELAITFLQKMEDLLVALSQRDDELSPVFELIDERLWYGLGRDR